MNNIETVILSEAHISEAEGPAVVLVL